MSTKKKTPKAYVIQDKYFLEAKKLGYRARSAFKLIEIQEKYNIIKPGQNVLDIGAAPGSFLQVIHKIIGDSAKLVGIDIQRIEPLNYKNLTLIQESIFEKDKLKAMFEEMGFGQFDLITSDIAPSTTGQTGVDQYRSVELNLAILDFAEIFLKKGGNLLLKVFVGEDTNDLVFPIKRKYNILKRTKPKACRERSFEEYFVCMGK
ncbi:MAG: RlmE family RNA methyltransferase, partial [Candidatus Gracilibacteria bacterium]|nr:RlmE family RNA methyltransferase [Candidatus Gracilibacteria bacterium]